MSRLFQEARALNQVAEFHDTFDHPIVEKPAIPAPERAKLRVSLLAEELKELQEAIDKGDIVEAADALCDLQYVLSGAIHEFGLSTKFNVLFNEVHRSNMSKACETLQEAHDTMEHYQEKDALEAGVDTTYKEVNNTFQVYRTIDKKTLKSINYSPADIAGILNS